MPTPTIAEYVSGINKILFTVTEHDYSHLEVVQLIHGLADAVHATEDVDWTTGEYDYAALGDLIVGAYWHLVYWHSGQGSDTYACLCALGRVFSPGMSCGPEDDTLEADVYEALDTIATVGA